jgi:hypothetical protein
MPSSRPTVPSNRPTVPCVVSAKGRSSSAERVTYTRLTVNDAELGDGKGGVSLRSLSRILGDIQDNVHEATLPARSDPKSNRVIVQGVALTSGKQTTVKHPLGQPFAGYGSTRAYAGSQPFSAVEAANNGGKDPSQYLVLTSSSTGTYDVEIFGI